jgi:hypothetical protein
LIPSLRKVKVVKLSTNLAILSTSCQVIFQQGCFTVLKTSTKRNIQPATAVVMKEQTFRNVFLFSNVGHMHQLPLFTVTPPRVVIGNTIKAVGLALNITCFGDAALTTFGHMRVYVHSLG